MFNQEYVPNWLFGDVLAMKVLCVAPAVPPETPSWNVFVVVPGIIVEVVEVVEVLVEVVPVVVVEVELVEVVVLAIEDVVIVVTPSAQYAVAGGGNGGVILTVNALDDFDIVVMVAPLIGSVNVALRGTTTVLRLDGNESPTGCASMRYGSIGNCARCKSAP